MSAIQALIYASLKDLLEGKESTKTPEARPAEPGVVDNLANSFSLLRDHPRLYMSLALAALACILRPTNVIIWATIGSMMLFVYPNPKTGLVLITAVLLTG
jgi:hypothetical protein